MSNLVIHKFELNAYLVNQPQTIKMPFGSRVLYAGIQTHFGQRKCHLYVWAEVNTANDMDPREFYIAYTGNEFPDREKWQYINTVQFGGYVLHIYAYGLFK